MAIYSMFNLSEMKDIIQRRNRGESFSEIAREYRLAWRVEAQLNLYERRQLNAQSLTSIRNLAGLFKVNSKSVLEHLERDMDSKTYKRRNQVYREVGRRLGGQSNARSPNRHKLTKEEMGKNNGAKKAKRAADK